MARLKAEEVDKKKFNRNKDIYEKQHTREW